MEPFRGRVQSAGDAGPRECDVTLADEAITITPAGAPPIALPRQQLEAALAAAAAP